MKDFIVCKTETAERREKHEMRPTSYVCVREKERSEREGIKEACSCVSFELVCESVCENTLQWFRRCVNLYQRSQIRCSYCPDGTDQFLLSSSCRPALLKSSLYKRGCVWGGVGEMQLVARSYGFHARRS